MIKARHGGDGLQHRVAAADSSMRHLKDAHRRSRQERHLLRIVLALDRAGSAGARAGGRRDLHIGRAAEVQRVLAVGRRRIGTSLGRLVLLRLLLFLVVADRVAAVVRHAAAESIGSCHQTVAQWVR